MKKINLIFPILIVFFILITSSISLAGGGGAGGGGGSGEGDCPDGSCPGSSSGSSSSGDGEGSCFLPGTLVTMSDGTFKKIEDIQVGEIVLGYDIKRDRYTNNRVLEIEAPIRSDWFMVTLEDGTVLRTTNDHPIYIEKGNDYKGWGSIDP
ncbi:hypothetical protein KKH36_02715, partial [Patescibacteria group bacterium]|nr:hypothetical protein [Patescibacteria group bacterium]